MFQFQPNAGCRSHHDEPRIACFSPGDSLSFGKTMISSHDQCETVRQKRNGIEIGKIRWFIGNRQINVPFACHIHAPSAGFFKNFNTYFRIFGTKRVDGFRDKANCHGRDAGDIHLPALDFLPRAHVRYLTREIRDDALRPRQKLLPHTTQHYLAGCTVN